MWKTIKGRNLKSIFIIQKGKKYTSIFIIQNKFILLRLKCQEHFQVTEDENFA